MNQQDTVAIKVEIRADGTAVITNLQKQLKSSTGKMKGHIKSVSSTIQGMTSNFLKSVGIIESTTMLIQSIGSGIRNLTAATVSFTSNFRQVHNLVETSNVDIGELRGNIIDTVGPMGDLGEITKGTYQIISSGQEAKKGLDLMKESATFAKGAAVDLESSVRVGTTVLNAYGKEAGGLSHIYDVLWQTIKDGVTTGPELAHALGRVVPVAYNAGLSIEEMAGSLAIMTQISGNTNESVTSLRGILSAIIKPSVEAAAEAKRIGVNFSVAGVKAKGFSGWLKDLDEKVKENNGDFAKMFGEVEALNGLFQLIRNSMGAYNTEMEKMSDVHDNSQRAFERYKESFSGAWETMKNKIQAIFIQELLPLLKDAANWVSANSEKITSFVQAGVNGFKTVAGFIAKFKDEIIFAGKAWLLYFSAKKVMSWGNTMVQAFGGMRGGILAAGKEFSNLGTYFGVLRAEGKGAIGALRGSLGELKKSGGLARGAMIGIGSAVAAWSLSKVVEAIGLINEISDLKEKEAEKARARHAEDNTRWEDQYQFMREYIRLLNEQGDMEMNAGKFAIEMSEAMRSAQGETYRQKLTYIKRHRDEYAALMPYIEGGIAKYQIESDIQTELTKKYQDKLKQLYLMKGVDLPAYYDQVSKKTKEVTAAVVSNIKKINEAFKKYGFLTGGVKELRAELNIIKGVFGKAGDQIYLNEEASKKLAGAIEALKKKYAAIGQEVPKDLKEIETATFVARSQIPYWNDDIQRIATNSDASMKKMGKSVDNAGGAWFSAAQIIKIANINVNDIGDTIEDVATKLLGFGQIIQKATGFLQEMGIIGEKTAKTLNGFSSGLSNVGGGIKAIQNAGPGFAGTIAGINGGLTIATGAVTLFTAGLEALGVTLGHDWEKWTDKVNHAGIRLGEFRGKVAELAEELRDNALSTYDASFQAFTATLPEVIRNANITAATLNQYAESVHNMFSQLDDIAAGKSSADISETLGSINDAFAALVEKQKKLGGAFSHEMVKMIGDARNRGIEIASISAYVQEQLAAGLAGYKQMLANIDPSGLQSQVTALLEQMAGMKKGTDEYIRAQEELTGLQSKLKDVTAAAEIFGGVNIATFDAMIDYENKVAANPSLVNAIRGWESAMMSLANTGEINQQQMSDFGRIATDSFTKLIENGFTAEQALKVLAPQLQTIRDLQSAYNLSIDDGTQSLIDQADEAGVLNKQAVDHNEMMIGLLGSIAEVLGATLPEKYLKLYGVLEETTPDMVDQVNILTDSLGGVTSEIDTIGSKIVGLDETWAESVTGNTIVEENKIWLASIKDIGAELFTVQGSIGLTDTIYQAFSENASGFTLTLGEAIGGLQTQMGDAIPANLENLQSLYELVMQQIAGSTEQVTLELDGISRSFQLIDDKLWEVQGTVTFAGQEYQAFTQVVSDATRDSWQKELEMVISKMEEIRENHIPSIQDDYHTAIENMEADTLYLEGVIESLETQLGITIPDTLESLESQYDYIMQQMANSTETYFLGPDGVLRNLLDTLALIGEQTAGEIGDNYGVYTDEQKQEMTIEFSQMAHLWRDNRATILSSEANISRFLNDLEDLVVIDEAQGQYNTFLASIRQWYNQVKAGKIWDEDNLQWITPEGFSRGGHFKVMQEEQHITVHRGERVDIWTAEQTRRMESAGHLPTLYDHYEEEPDGGSDFLDDGDSDGDGYDGLEPFEINVPASTGDGQGKTEINIEVSISAPVEINISSLEKLDIDELSDKLAEKLEDRHGKLADAVGEVVAQKLQERLNS